MKRTSVWGWREALDTATEWELFDARRLPPIPRWAKVGIAAGWLVLTVASLAAALWGGPS
jgi:hypothetical protein